MLNTRFRNDNTLLADLTRIPQLQFQETIAWSRLEAIKFLVACGANPLITNRADGKHAFKLCKLRKQTDLVNYFVGVVGDSAASEMDNAEDEDE
jgi:hypothetical protein